MLISLPRTVTAVLEMTSSFSSPVYSVDLDTIDTSLSDITVLEKVNNSNRNSRSLEGSVQPIPDLIPKHFYQTSNEKVANDLEIKESGRRRLESIILLSMLLATVVALYLFPQE